MTLFEQLKSLPKIDLHINLTGSISSNLAFDLTKENIQDIEEKMIQKHALDYYDSLSLPIKILNCERNISLAVDDLITRLIDNNVIYSELFLDLAIYNKEIDLDKLINIVLKVIKKRDYHMQLVICLSSKDSKEEHLNILNIFDKYYLNGVNGVYFIKDKMDNLNDYSYIFDRLIRNNIPYILNLDSKITSQDFEIYSKARRIIYSLKDSDSDLISILQDKSITLEFCISNLIESNVIINMKDYIIYDLIKGRYLITLVSMNMATLNTDILNEYCMLFNNYPLTILELVKLMLNDLINVNLPLEEKNKLINFFKEKSNEVL